MRIRVIPFLLLLGPLLPGESTAQRLFKRTQISGAPSCASCRIEVTHIARLGEDPDGYIAGLVAVIFKDSRNRWFVFESMTRGEEKIYEFDGTFLMFFGRAGEGPGEFGNVAYMHEYPPDTLNFFDWQNGRISRFTVDLEYLDQRPLRVLPLYALMTNEGQITVNQAISQPDGRVLPLHFIGENGRPSVSFGHPQMPYETGGQNHHIRMITQGRDGGIWAGVLNRYEVGLWSRTGTLLEIVERNVGWFKPHSDPSRRANPRADAPNPRLQAIKEERRDRLWTAVLVPEEGWEDAFYTKRLASGLLVDEPVIDRHYDTRIEVLDPEREAVLASVTLPEAVGGFVGHAGPDVFVYAHRQGPEGTPLTDIWRLRLLERSTSPGEENHE